MYCSGTDLLKTRRSAALMGTVFFFFSFFQTFLISGEGVAVALLLQLLSEVHDVLPCHEALTAQGRDYFLEQGPLDGEVLRSGRLEQHRVQDG